MYTYSNSNFRFYILGLDCSLFSEIVMVFVIRFSFTKSSPFWKIRKRYSSALLFLVYLLLFCPIRAFFNAVVDVFWRDCKLLRIYCPVCLHERAFLPSWIKSQCKLVVLMYKEKKHFFWHWINTFRPKDLFWESIQNYRHAVQGFCKWIAKVFFAMTFVQMKLNKPWRRFILHVHCLRRVCYSSHYSSALSRPSRDTADTNLSPCAAFRQKLY